MAWERRRYRGNKVWILFDEAGQASLDDRGHAQLRYKPDDDRTYSVRLGEILPLDAASDATPPEPTQAPIQAWIHVGPPSPDGQVGVGILLAWRDRRREITRRLPAASDDEISVGAVLEALRAIRKPGWPVRVLTAGADRLVAIRAGAGTVPPACGEALRQATEAFADLEILPTATPPSPDAELAARLARAAHAG